MVARTVDLTVGVMVGLWVVSWVVNLVVKSAVDWVVSKVVRRAGERVGLLAGWTAVLMEWKLVERKDCEWVALWASMWAGHWVALKAGTLVVQSVASAALLVDWLAVMMAGRSACALVQRTACLSVYCWVVWMGSQMAVWRAERLDFR